MIAPDASGAAHADLAQVVAHTARLARLELQPDEARRLQGELAQILGFFEALQEVDTADVAPMLHPTGTTTPLRDDEARPGLVGTAILAQAPQAEDGRFVVPRVVG